MSGSKRKMGPGPGWLCCWSVDRRRARFLYAKFLIGTPPVPPPVRQPRKAPGAFRRRLLWRRWKPPPPRRSRPTYVFKTADGADTASAFRGKVVLVNLWAMWCCAVPHRDADAGRLAEGL
jgi:hypothetical protein